MRTRPWLISILSLPMLALLGWLLYEQIPVWTAPTPRWVISCSTEKPDPICALVRQSLISYRQKPVDIQYAPVSIEQAVAIIDRVVARYNGPRMPWSVLNPELRWVDFPDATHRLVWMEQVLANSTFDVMWGEEYDVYVDAATGEALLLATGIEVGDPCMTIGCGFLPAWLARLSLAQYQALFWMVIYLLAMGGLSLIVRLARRSPKEH